jgi:hypothetical protein
MSSTVAGINRIGYLLPEEESHRPMREALLDRIDAYNKGVLAQFSTEADPLGKKEMNGQLITIGHQNGQFILNIPEAIGPMSAVSKNLLELTRLDQRIQVTKSCTKDYNQELTREVVLGEKFRYTIKDETGQVLINGNSPSLMARSMQQMKHQVEGEGLTKTFVLSERQPFGFLKNQVEIKIEQGVTVKAVQNPEFNERIQAEKNQRSQAPDTESKPHQIKPRL